MFCSKCGKEINNEAVVCVHCGCAVENTVKKSSSDSTSGTLAILALVCAFLIPIAGLILGIIGVNKYGASQAQYKQYSIGAIIISVVVWVISFVVLMAMGGKRKTWERRVKRLAFSLQNQTIYAIIMEKTKGDHIMTRKKLSLIFLISGTVLFALSAILMIFAFSSVETGGIIGGADKPTWEFIFFHRYHGLCFWTSLLGLISWGVGGAIGLMKEK